MKVGVVLALLALCSAVPLDSAAETDALQFLSGFLSGLRLDAKAPSACYNDTLALKDDVRDIIWDLERLFKGDEMGLMALLSDVKGIQADAKTAEADCKVSTLLFKLKELVNANWEDIIIGRVVGHAGALINDAKELVNGSVTAKGAAVGDLFKVITDWGI